MKKIFRYTIAKETEYQTAGAYLCSIGYSRKLLIRLKSTPDGLTVNGQRICTNRPMFDGEVLTVTLEEQDSPGQILPVKLPLNIVYEDEHLMVVNKAANVPIHPSQGNYDNTLANGIAWYFREKGEPFVFRAINRLDRDTTGLLILAKHMLSACMLSDMVRQGQIRRQYLAVADGCVPSDGTITAPIARVSGSTIERCVSYEQGEYACTHYRRLTYYPDYDLSLVTLKLDTGRTHQIRVHLKHIGHPLPGDFLYHADYRYIKRQSLHSWKLSFTHPITGADMRFYAPLPEDMRFLFSHSQIPAQPKP